jgi:archaeosortase B (VPXXXP-CTERM-specific)
MDRLWRVWDRNRPVLGYWLIFVVLLAAFHVSLTVGERLWAVVDAATASLLAWSLSLFGLSARADGSLVMSSLCSVKIIRECTAVHPIAIFCAAVVAYPLSWRARLLGLAAGSPILLLVNQVRLVSLCYIDRWYPSALETAHMVVWQSLIVLTALVF